MIKVSISAPGLDIESRASASVRRAQPKDLVTVDQCDAASRYPNPSLALKLKAMPGMPTGAPNLASPEVKIHLHSAESSDTIDVEQKEREIRETSGFVEEFWPEFMLLANISVAPEIEETFPQTAIHDNIWISGGLFQNVSIHANNILVSGGTWVVETNLNELQVLKENEKVLRQENRALKEANEAMFKEIVYLKKKLQDYGQN